jgi:hypothetical protein
MLTTAITAAITALLAMLGVEPGLYVAPLWIAVKVIVVTPLVGGGYLMMKRKLEADEAAQKAAQAAADAATAAARSAAPAAPPEGRS